MIEPYKSRASPFNSPAINPILSPLASKNAISFAHCLKTS